MNQDQTQARPPPIERTGSSQLPVAEMGGCLGAMRWFGAAFVLPCFSLSFYRRAVQGSMLIAMAFFFLFAFTITALQTLGLVRSMLVVGGRIWDVHARGSFPDIRISGGVAEVDGPQPFTIYEERGTLVALDTTGEIMDIDRSRYHQGLLLTRRHLILLTPQGEYNRIGLSDLQMAAASGPIFLDGDTITGTMAALATTISIFGFLLYFLLNSLARLAVLILFALIFWVAAFILRKEASFGEIASVGIYAIVPATYLHLLFSQAGFEFFGMYTLVFFVLWVMALFAAYYPLQIGGRAPGLRGYLRSERPLRAWRALLGLPLLSLLGAQMVMDWENWALAWGAFGLTMLVLVLVSLVPLLKKNAGALEAGSSL
jgi:hypothetical protein